jgi:twitching motility protein PilT
VPDQPTSDDLASSESTLLRPPTERRLLGNRTAFSRLRDPGALGAPPVPPEGPSPEVVELKERLDTLSQQIPQLQAAMAPIAKIPILQQGLISLQHMLQAQQIVLDELKSDMKEHLARPKPVSLDVSFEMDLHPPQPADLKFKLEDLLRVVIKHRASDLHLKANSPPTVRLNGELLPIGDKVLTEEDCRFLVLSAIPEGKKQRLLHLREVDHAHVSQGVRFRMNAFLERGWLSAAFRMVSSAIPPFAELGLPPVMGRLAGLHHGLVLVTGPAGCGKSTTLAALIDFINKNRKVHVVTIEDPIEYFHNDEQSFITQREIGTDTASFAEALRQALRQDPNVIMVGEMRDAETMLTAVTAAETGHLVLSTLHTPNTVQAVDRIVDAFQGNQQKQIRTLLSSCLRGVISQKLLQRADGRGRVPAIEVLVCTSTIASLIQEGNTKEIYQYIQQGAHEGMQTFTNSLTRLVEMGQVTREEALFHADQATELRLATRHSEQQQAPGTGNNPTGSYLNWL